MATGRFEREFKTSFTQEELQAIYETFEIDVDETGRPSTTRMRRLIRAQVGIAESLEAADDSTFRKAGLQAIADGLAAAHLRFQSTLPQRVTTSWDVVTDMLYYLSLLFGVLVLPKATLYGVWTEKHDTNWQHEETDIDCRGTGSNLQRILARHRQIASEFERIAR